MHGVFLALSLNKNKTNIYIQLKVQFPFPSCLFTTGPTPLPGLHTVLTYETSTNIILAAAGVDVLMQHLHKLPTLLPRKWLCHQVIHITTCIDVCSSPLVPCISFS